MVDLKLPKLSAVLIPVYRDADDVRIVLIERGAGGMHGGQVALPGGKPEPGDASLLDTALREAEEETGLLRSQVTVLAALDPVDTRTSGFRVHPFLARVPGDVCYRPRDGEVAAVFTASARRILDPASRCTRTLDFRGWAEPQSVECVLLEDHRLLWGLTLRILDPLLPRLLAGEWPAIGWRR